MKKLSTRNEWYIPHYRYLELKYYCLQYPIWESAYNSIDSMVTSNPEKLTMFEHPGSVSKPVERAIDTCLALKKRMDMIHDAVFEACDGKEALANRLLDAVVHDKSYDTLQANDTMPVSRGEYYNAYHRFFWILSKSRN